MIILHSMLNAGVMQSHHPIQPFSFGAGGRHSFYKMDVFSMESTLNPGKQRRKTAQFVSIHKKQLSPEKSLQSCRNMWIHGYLIL